MLRLLVLDVGEALAEHGMCVVAGHVHVFHGAVRAEYLVDVVFGHVAAQATHEDTRQRHRLHLGDELVDDRVTLRRTIALSFGRSIFQVENYLFSETLSCEIVREAYVDLYKK